MEHPERQPAAEPKEGERIEEADIEREDGLNDAEAAGPESELPFEQT
jgi:hypothetical protein